MAIVKRFEEIAKNLFPSQEFTTQGNLIADKVFKALDAATGFSIDRRIIAGSMGKKTALNEDFEPDYDLVVFLNPDPKKKQPQILEEFVKVLTAADTANKLKTISKTKVTRFSVQFTLDVEFEGKMRKLEFDLLPAINFGKNQAKGAMTEIQKRMDGSGDAGEAVHYISPCLAEETLGFMKEMAEPSTRGIILVAKYWDRVVKEKTKGKGTVTGLISGRSHIIELIAIHANSNLQLPAHEKNLVYYGFLRFLKAMEYIDKLSVIFFVKYEEKDVPRDVMMEKTSPPFVLDPVNFYNNLGKGLKEVPGAVEAYKKFAAGTLRALQRLEQGTTTIGVNQINRDNFHELIVVA